MAVQILLVGTPGTFEGQSVTWKHLPNSAQPFQFSGAT